MTATRVPLCPASWLAGGARRAKRAREQHIVLKVNVLHQFFFELGQAVVDEVVGNGRSPSRTS